MVGNAAVMFVEGGDGFLAVAIVAYSFTPQGRGVMLSVHSSDNPVRHTRLNDSE